MNLNLSTMIYLLILQGAAVVLFCSWCFDLSPSSFFPCNVQNRGSGQTHVLLLSSWRSGSTFMGEVLGQHPSVFYLTEPSFYVWTPMPQQGARRLRMAVRDLLRSLYKCDFSAVQSYLPEEHKMSYTFVWHQSRALCSPPVCPLTPRNQTSNEDLCRLSCTTPSLEKVQEACHTYSHVVLKETRIFELESLYSLLQDPSLDLRIIHLVRDPRAVTRSRTELAASFRENSAMVLEHRDVPAAEVKFQVTKEVCRSHVSINQRATMNPPPFLKGRYKLVRYEDVVHNPLEEITALYEFVGLEMTERLMDWIYTMTHGTNSSRHGGYHINSRDALTISQAWRTVLPHRDVRHVQEVCEEAMRLLGYKEVHSKKEQKRLDIDLLLPLEPHKFNRSLAKNPGNI